MQPQTTLTPRRWLEPEPVYVPADLRARVGGHPLLAQTLIRRGYADPDRAAAFLDPDLYAPADPRDLPDMDAAAERIEAAIARGERILVWGDFDVDGQTATATLVSVLADLGADVGYRVPVRADESHGLNLPVLARFLCVAAELVTGTEEPVLATATYRWHRLRRDCAGRHWLSWHSWRVVRHAHSGSRIQPWLLVRRTKCSPSGDQATSTMASP